MGEPLSVVFSDTCMTKLLPPWKSKLYQRCVDHIFTRGRTDVPDKLWEFFNNYQSNIKLTYEIDPGVFLETKICYSNSWITIKEHRRLTEVTKHWFLSIPKSYKRNAFGGDLCRAECISSDFIKKKMLIHQKFDNADYSSSVIRDYELKQNERQEQEDNSNVLIFFKLDKESILVEFLYFPQSELVAKLFLSKFHQFINQKFYVTIEWITRKVKNLFSSKDKNPYPVCEIFKGKRACDETYIGETIKNFDIWCHKHEGIHKEFNLQDIWEKIWRKNWNRRPFSRSLKDSKSEKILKPLL